MDTKTEEDGWRSFLAHCLQIKNAKDLNAFFTVFLTAKEREEVAGRSLIVKELLQGEKTHREIARSLKVSIAKISRGSNVLKTTEPRLKKYLE